MMTCYFRHLQSVFKEAEIEVTEENKRDLDKIIHRIIHVKYRNCPTTWKEVKKLIAEDEGNFVATLKEEWAKR
jgi:hypothetical protein